MLDTFIKDVANAADEFTKSAPYSHEKITVEAASAFVEAAKQQVAEFRRRSGELKSGMDIFAIPQPQYKVSSWGTGSVPAGHAACSAWARHL